MSEEQEEAFEEDDVLEEDEIFEEKVLEYEDRSTTADSNNNIYNDELPSPVLPLTVDKEAWEEYYVLLD